MIEDILKKRTNCSFFREDKIPDKKIIDDILNKAHNLTPYKNNFIHYDIEVYGPEYNDEKKYVAMSTVCSHAKHKYSKKLASKETMDELEKIYDDWLVAQSNLKSKQDFYDMRKKFDGIHFNNQVRAPYLLVYTKKKDMVTESQKQSDYYKSGKVTSIFQTNKPNQGMWLVQSGMNSIITSMLSVEKGLDVSFCKCYFYNSNIHTNILRKALKNSNDIAFLLGIGYADTTKHQYKSWVKIPTLDEIVKWV